jgi:hypothetical protein
MTKTVWDKYDIKDKEEKLRSKNSIEQMYYTIYTWAKTNEIDKRLFIHLIMYTQKEFDN